MEELLAKYMDILASSTAHHMIKSVKTRLALIIALEVGPAVMDNVCAMTDISERTV
jgi:hypothetical protein